MPSIYGVKPKFQNLLRVLTNALARAGVYRKPGHAPGHGVVGFEIGALGLLLGLNLPIVPVVHYVLWFVLALLLLTIVNRARKALAELRGSAAR